MDGLTTEELEREKTSSSNCNDINYCRFIANLFLHDKFTAPARINLNKSCNHYSFTDGQHRTCVVSKLLNLGADVNLRANYQEQNCECIYCRRKKDLIIKKGDIFFFDKLFKTKKYIYFEKSRNDFDVRYHLIKLQTIL
ncbi:hypothetical protein KLM53_17075 [Clostridioides difficile]|nr:hypothetical protein [Clostridioides difficile]